MCLQYYQGLKLYGMHKKEWAQERSGRRNHYGSNNLASQDSPILQVARTGNLAALEWLLSDTPARLYKQYCADISNDKRLIALSKAYGDSSTAVDTWLGTKCKSRYCLKYSERIKTKHQTCSAACASPCGAI